MDAEQIELSPMAESKLVLSKRLQREGRYNEAFLYKDLMLKELRAKKVFGEKAKEESWRLMAKKYPPKPELEPKKPVKEKPVEKKFEPLEVADDLPDSTPDTFLQDATWVYNNLRRRGASLQNAPTSGAVGLLEWARDNPNDFYKQTWPKALGLVGSQKPDVDDETSRNLDHVKSLEEMLR